LTKVNDAERRKFVDHYREDILTLETINGMEMEVSLSLTMTLTLTLTLETINGMEMEVSLSLTLSLTLTLTLTLIVTPNRVPDPDPNLTPGS